MQVDGFLELVVKPSRLRPLPRSPVGVTAQRHGRHAPAPLACSPPLYSMKPSFMNLFMNELTRTKWCRPTRRGFLD